MQRRAVLRRAFPYLVIGIGGFALAYIVIYVFVLPSKILPAAPPPYIPDSSHILVPIDTALTAPEQSAPGVATIPMATPSGEPLPVQLPDLVGMALPDARGILNGLRLRTVVTRDTSSLQPPSTVLRQLPLAQAGVPPNGIVTLTVSYFPDDTARDSNAVHDTMDRITPDTAPSGMHVQRGSKLPPIMSAEPDTSRHPNP